MTQGVMSDERGREKGCEEMTDDIMKYRIGKTDARNSLARVTV